MPRKRHVSRKHHRRPVLTGRRVMPRKRHVSRKCKVEPGDLGAPVMPRKRHVSRKIKFAIRYARHKGHASQEACE